MEDNNVAVCYESAPAFLYKLQLVDALPNNNRVARHNFCIDFQRKIQEDDSFVKRAIFNDESAFQLCGKVKRHDIRVWGTGNLHQVVELQRVSPNVNVLCITFFQGKGLWAFLPLRRRYNRCVLSQRVN